MWFYGHYNFIHVEIGRFLNLWWLPVTIIPPPQVSTYIILYPRAYRWRTFRTVYYYWLAPSDVPSPPICRSVQWDLLQLHPKWKNGRTWYRYTHISDGLLRQTPFDFSSSTWLWSKRTKSGRSPTFKGCIMRYFQI